MRVGLYKADGQIRLAQSTWRSQDTGSQRRTQRKGSQGNHVTSLTSTQSNSLAGKRRLAKSSFMLWLNRGTYSPRVVREVRSCEEDAASLDDQSLRTKAQSLRHAALSQRKTDPKLVAQYSGLVAQAVTRTFGFRMHDVQIRGMLAGSDGAIVEMQTGEGKTVVTGAMAALKSLQAKTIHVATTNAYLATRDREELMPVFERLGLSSGILPEETNQQETQQAYSNDITYGPGYQFGFDYLRDQVVLRTNRQTDLGRKTLDALLGNDIRNQLMQPELHDAMIIDEADSVMIDEAVTPLVISGAARDTTDPTPFLLAKKIAAELVLDDDFTIELPDKSIEVNDDASDRFHEAIASESSLHLERPWRIYISNALRALHVLRRDIDYVVQEGEVQIVDQNTGRIFSDRTWQDGLHQAVEAKEKVEIKSNDPSVARITRQRYLQMYQQLAGLTGTAHAVAGEFQSVYKTRVVQIPTNLPSQRNLLKTRFFGDLDAKLAAITADVIERNRAGQPILVGTRTIAESMQVADCLTAAGIHAVLLNGVQDQEEAEIVAAAGTAGAITIATNMAGRGTDIKLDQRAHEAGGLHVVGCSHNGSTRIDRQLIGRAARQGNPGSAQFFVAPEDELLATYAPKLALRIAAQAKSDGETRSSFSNELAAVQAQIEHKQFHIRQAMVREDQWMDLVRASIEG